MERVLNAVERILISQAFSPGQAIESSPVCMHEPSSPFEKSRARRTRRRAILFCSRHPPGGGRRLGRLERCHERRKSAPVTRLTSVIESNGKSMAAWAFRMASSSGPDMKQKALPS